MQTLRRDVKQGIENILKKYDIADRDALFEELVAIFDQGRPPQSSKEWERIFAASETQIRAQVAMLKRLEKVLGITPNGRPEWDTIARFLIEKDAAGETIEKFAKNCAADPFNTPKAHQIAKDPMAIKANWINVMRGKGKGNSHKPDYTQDPDLYYLQANKNGAQRADSIARLEAQGMIEKAKAYLKPQELESLYVHTPA